ncbi:MAG: DUF177 domain-containing protein [Ardenticatenia bacterium]|nr:DUF177 domain-containing protein [Ardenticatenia bacterium]
MFEFNVAGLLKELTGATRSYVIDEPLGDVDPELVAVEPVQGVVKFTRTHDGILVEGKLASVFEVACIRCLETFHLPLTIEIEEEFHPSIDLRTGASLPVLPGEEETTISPQHILDLTEVIRQLFLLAFPAMPTCTQKCQGICPLCGQNRNVRPCTCANHIVDSRWAALAELLNR